jgi:hypothetical protein
MDEQRTPWTYRRLNQVPWRNTYKFWTKGNLKKIFKFYRLSNFKFIQPFLWPNFKVDLNCDIHMQPKFDVWSWNTVDIWRGFIFNMKPKLNFFFNVTERHYKQCWDNVNIWRCFTFYMKRKFNVVSTITVTIIQSWVATLN